MAADGKILRTGRRHYDAFESRADYCEDQQDYDYAGTELFDG